MSPPAWSPNWSMPAGSLGRWADDYERGRPGWPAAALDVPVRPPGGRAVELGAGTGKLTRLLVRRFDHVTAVEPAPEMRRLLVSCCPEAEALQGSAEAIPVADRWADAVFAAEAFHHFDGARALAEISRVLRPDGLLVLMWNLPAGPVVPPVAAVEELLLERAPVAQLDHEPLDLNTRRYASGAWREPFAGSRLDPLHEARVPNPQVLDRDGLVAFFASMGWVGDLPDAERQPLLDAVRALLDAAEYRRPWETHVHWARLGDGAAS